MHILTQAALTTIQELWQRVSDAEDTNQVPGLGLIQLWELIANTSEAYALQHQAAMDDDGWAMFTWLQDIALIRGSRVEITKPPQKLQLVDSMNRVIQ